MTALEENKELVERASFDVFTEGDLDIIDELVSDDFVLHDATSPEEPRGRDALKEYVQTYRDAFSDLDASMDMVVAEGDVVAVSFTVRGTHTGRLPEAPDLEPTGKEIEIAGMEFDRIEDGQLVETWQIYDAFGLLQQLGVGPTEEPPKGSAE